MVKLASVLFVLSSLTASAQATQGDLQKRLIKQPLYLCGLWIGDDLHFGSNGRLLDTSETTSLALSGIEVDKVDLKSDRLVVTGKRVGLEFSGFAYKRIVLKKHAGKKVVEEPITITIGRPDTGDYSVPLGVIFTSDLSTLGTVAPSYWRIFFAQLAGASPTPEVNFLGGPIYRVGGRVSEPLVLNQPEPEFNEYAKSLQYTGTVEVAFIVDKSGHPVSLEIRKPLGMGLDEVAVEAVRRYTFASAMLMGKPVPVNLAVEVKFEIK